jgi:hypothetical protein
LAFQPGAFGRVATGENHRLANVQRLAMAPVQWQRQALCVAPPCARPKGVAIHIDELIEVDEFDVTLELG